MSLLNDSQHKCVIHTTDGGDLSPNHVFHDLVDKTMKNILRCESLLNNYADNTFESPSFNDRDRRTRVRGIRQYLGKYPPTINLLPFEPCHDVRMCIQNNPRNGRTYWNLASDANRQFSAGCIELDTVIVDALDRSANKANDDTFRLLSGLIVVILVHEIAHVVHATFAKIPTLNRVDVYRLWYVDQVYDVGEPGDCAENVLSGNKGEFWVNCGTEDYESIETLEIRGAYIVDDRGIRNQLVCAVNARDSVVNELIEGEWDPAPAFPRQAVPKFPKRAKKASAYHTIDMSGSAPQAAHPNLSHIPRETFETSMPYRRASGSTMRDGKYYRI